MNWQAMLRTRWQAASRREQRSLMLAGGVVALALLWWLTLAPALSVWRTAPGQHLQLQAQMQHMQTLQAQARALQALPTLNAAESRRALEDSLKALGKSAQVTVQTGRLNVALKGVSAQALALWLSSSRQNAHLVPTEVHLTRAAEAWDGSVVFTLSAQ
ncbi:type II secretion system protein GspM [Rhodoferax sp.]|uniref:type II secretion system protein GspM n=1 Tax=Rhodoferax sp. TaxID=50421 RepID=UPI00283AD863|nr:type II secretion system protein GspM [Rhodoferax sp.]MDR3367583.1 type II secretion system protein GspM [Rhodoferax sp.]